MNTLAVRMSFSQSASFARRILFVLTLGFSMTTQSLSQDTVSSALFSLYDQFKVHSITTRVFTQQQLAAWISDLHARGAFRVERAGTSAEGRDVLLLTVGRGPTTVLLWSQMHGDESTATMALIDMLSFFSLFPDNPIAQSITDHLSVAFLPMINPDGAERFARRTAQLIDMNRDALMLQTPEAQLLKATRDRLSPQFGFNLHDQNPRYSVGSTKKVAAISLLAPALDEERSDPPVRQRAKLVGATLAQILESLIPGHVARYDDTFEPRAFGDNIQKWGTSTVLIESGGWPGDPHKMFLRKLNAVALLSVLYEISQGSYQKAHLAAYESLPFNREQFYDLIIRGATVRTSDALPPIVADVGINFEGSTQDPDSSSDSTYACIVDLGDLHTFGSFEEIDGKDVELDSTVVQLEKRILKSQLMQIIGRN